MRAWYPVVGLCTLGACQLVAGITDYEPGNGDGGTAGMGGEGVGAGGEGGSAGGAGGAGGGTGAGTPFLAGIWTQPNEGDGYQVIDVATHGHQVAVLATQELGATTRYTDLFDGISSAAHVTLLDGLTGSAAVVAEFEIGPGGFVAPTSLVATTDGVAVAGVLSDPATLNGVDIGPAATAGSRQLFLAGMDTSLQTQFSTTSLEVPPATTVAGIAVTPNNLIVVAGESSGGFDIDGGQCLGAVDPSARAWVALYDTAMVAPVCEALHFFHALSGEIFLHDVAVAADRIFVVGAFTGRMQFGPMDTIDAVGTRSGFIAYADLTLGTWTVERMDGMGFNSVASLTPGPGHFTLAGEFQGTFEDEVSIESRSTFVQLRNADTNAKRFTRAFGETALAQAPGGVVTTEADGETIVLTTITCRGDIDNDDIQLPAVTNDEPDICAVGFAGDGSALFTQRWGGQGTDAAGPMVIVPVMFDGQEGTVFAVTGNTADAIDFGNGIEVRGTPSSPRGFVTGVVLATED